MTMRDSTMRALMCLPAAVFAVGVAAGSLDVMALAVVPLIANSIIFANVK